jgi:radical SAM protein with 4Fe4S-binding SPASM domain
MGNLFDRLTESDAERDLMTLIRSGAVSASDLPRAIPRFPLKLQIQTISPCNARCLMCPWPITMKSQSQGRMSDTTFDHLVEQIAGKPLERIGLFLMNEPLLDPELEARCARIREAVPGGRRVIFTNGQLLSRERAMSLEEHGLDEVDISVIGFSRRTHEHYMNGIDHDRVMENLDALSRAAALGHFPGLQIKIVTLDLPGVGEEAEEFRRRTTLPVFVKPVTNRGGLIDVESLGRDAIEGPARVACQRPFVKAYVLYNGDMVLCNCDWERTTIIGNLAEEPLERLWHAASLQAIREAHRSGQLVKDSICASCDYPWLT